MKKLILITLLIHGSLHAQTKKGTYTISVTPLVGYETNLLKSPSYYEKKDGTAFYKEDLWVNTFFTGGKFRFKTTSKRKQHTFDFKSNFKSSMFSSDKNIKSSVLLIGSNYIYKSKKKWHTNFGVNYKSMLKTGGLDNDDLIGSPLTYKNYRVSNKFSYNLSKEWLIFTKAFIGLKNYYRKDYKQFKYLEKGISTGFEFKATKDPKIKLTLFGEVKQRLYTIKKMKNTENNPNDLNRQWRYFTFGEKFDFPIKKYSKITIKGGYLKMQDVSHDKYGYNQFHGGLAYSLTKNKVKLTVSTDLIQKSYTKLKIKDNMGVSQNLIYNYTRLKIGIAYKLKPNLTVSIEGKERFRLSNVDQLNSKTTRNYFTNQIIVGLKWDLKRKYK